MLHIFFQTKKNQFYVVVQCLCMLLYLLSPQADAAPVVTGVTPVIWQSDLLLQEPDAAEIEAFRARTPQLHIVAIGRQLQVPATAWQSVGTGVWRLRVESVAAARIGFVAEDMNLPTGAFLKIYGLAASSGEHILEGRGNASGNRGISAMVDGSRLVIELHTPAGSTLQPVDFPFRIPILNHALPEPGSGFQPLRQQDPDDDPFVLEDLCSEPQHYPRYSNQSSSVMLLTFPVISGGRGQCTGSWIDNGPPDGSARANYLLSAWHCFTRSFSSPAADDNLPAVRVTWHRLSRNLAGNYCSSAPSREVRRTMEVRLIAWNERLDIVLLRMAQAPPATAMPQPGSLTKPDISTSVAIFSLGHPMGMPQQLYEGTVDSFGITTRIDAARALIASCTFPERCTHIRVQSTLGLIEGGASGSAAYDTSFDPPRIIGVVTTSGDNRASFGSLPAAIASDSRMRLALRWGEDYYDRCVDIDDPENAPEACENLNVERICNALDLSADHCMAIGGFSVLPAMPPWGVSTMTSVAGSESLVSLDVIGGSANGLGGCLFLELDLPARSLVSFYWRVSSELNFDRLRYGVNIQGRLPVIGQISGEIQWRKFSGFNEEAVSELIWCYDKDFSSAIGQDRAWIDNLEFSAAVGIIADNSLQPRSEGEPPWLFRVLLPDLLSGGVTIGFSSTGTASIGRDYSISASFSTGAGSGGGPMSGGMPSDGSGITVPSIPGIPGIPSPSPASTNTATETTLTIRFDGSGGVIEVPAGINSFELAVTPRADNAVSEPDRLAVLVFSDLTPAVAISTPVIISQQAEAGHSRQRCRNRPQPVFGAPSRLCDTRRWWQQVLGSESIRRAGIAGGGSGDRCRCW